MPREFHPAGILAESRRLFEAIRAWAERQGSATIIGGWAAFELVREETNRQSRDVDIILHNAASLEAFDRMLPTWGLEWDQSDKGRGMECFRTGDERKEILVDVFTPNPEVDFFRGHAYDHPSKPAMYGVFPDVAFMILDKVRTVPLRQGRDAYLKKAKDLLDIRDLVFFNREGRLPLDLLVLAAPAERREALRQVPLALVHAPGFEREIRDAERWLRSGLQG